MDQKRRAEYNRISTEIRNLKNYIRVNETTIQNTKRSCKDLAFSEQQLQKLRAENQAYQAKIDELNNRTTQLAQGHLDDEINDQIKEETRALENKREITLQKKQEAKKEKIQKQIISENYYQYNRASDRDFSRMQKEMDRSYKYFQRTCDGIPDYMLAKLKDMPNNKGYIWRDIYCFGERPVEPNQPTVMFENKRGGTLVIHEWTNTEYRKYKKNGKEHKKLFYKTSRHVKRPGV